MLNPESRRGSPRRGRPSATLGGWSADGHGLADDPLLFTGGGRTELELDLLFDTQLGGSTVETKDVQDLTRPLWELAENVTGPDGAGARGPCGWCGARRGMCRAW